MKTNGINNTGELSLENVTNDKLIKMRDVALDHLQDSFKEYMEARDRVLEIRQAMVKRGMVVDSK
ncbi:hypothetical protein [Escherichia phage phiWec190]|uniref:hypothetical protein n=1 Tax=Escherichia coli TaxID=562 RepID=UPI001FF51FF7|nr:hypothetical protein [Escherichia coli]BDU12263.1 hypothetical protein [Escherichia phage phiWec179]BDU12487.1 hypothetical protein [Escherichia phage phiWec181]BDU12632.1 hypothetical protein [Escherichia phage phiWec186]BDU13142.1 hypothetical protein [Escherichia phage phiWec188]BDU13761.1 hypothetical protein [Escherichia phage phiWec190]